LTRTRPEIQSAASANGRPITGNSPSNPYTKHRNEFFNI
jgi:hypothetical protein